MKTSTDAGALPEAVLVVVGLKREARLLAGAGVRTVVGGGDAEGLRARLQQALSNGPIVGVISVGLAGALSPAVQVGDWVVANRIVAEASAWTVDPTLENRLRTMLDSIGRFKKLHAPSRRTVEVSRVFTGAIAGSDVMVVNTAAKVALHVTTGALAVDMESHIAAQFVSAYGLPFAALRVISDGADRALPKAAQAGMKPNGGMDIVAVFKALAKDPRQFPALIRTSREAEIAFRALALLGRHDLLGRLGVGELNLGELPLDVA